MHWHSLSKQPCTQRHYSITNCCSDEEDALLIRMWIADMNAPVALHRRGQQFPPFFQKPGTEMTVHIRQKSKKSVLASRPKPLQLQSGWHQRLQFAGLHNIIDIDNICDIAEKSWHRHIFAQSSQKTAIPYRIEQQSQVGMMPGNIAPHCLIQPPLPQHHLRHQQKPDEKKHKTDRI